MRNFRVYISPLTIDRPRYATLAAMDAWCNTHAPGRWEHAMSITHRDEHGNPHGIQPDYNTFVFEDANVAALFKLTWWKPA